ncbi:hypothetical protein Aph01nite_62400 [Acrocarpospora phusangensis]|uniref:4Fe-4S Wbl-type domain-containing protein n=1 Tax=Acrocarpospora phusangensis TaxID=1070424 RepID=A0A919QIB2_9ACTN|nr:WhiB family transcriptional regulator [Acrocarpospora phusangensis]GIH27930.1 hypothetical protein Aph01nite_62400 [Acrocarpospora phusangensis]
MARTLTRSRTSSGQRLGYLSLRDALIDGLPLELAEGAACTSDPELHTGPDLFTDEPADERAAREDVAKSVCAECPARLHCLAYAMEVRPEVGVWAGYTADELAREAAGQRRDAA